jgi:proteasome accessory factor B
MKRVLAGKRASRTPRPSPLHPFAFDPMIRCISYYGQREIGTWFCPRRGVGLLNRNQRASVRQLSLAAYLLSSGTWGRQESAIRENLPPYADVYASSLGENEDRDRASDALRKQLARDVEALAGAGIKVDIEGEADGRRYRLLPSSFSPVPLDLSREERAVLVGALRELRRDFPYAGPLRLAVANLIGAASADSSGQGEGENSESDGAAFAAAVATSEDEEVSGRVGRLESAVARRKRVRFDYYSISRDETTGREVEPYALSLLDGTWYMTGWDTGREAVRQFRLSRVRSRIVFATKKEAGDFEVPQNFERRFAGPRAPWQLGEPNRRARIRVSNEAFAAARKKYLWAVSWDTWDKTDQGRVLSTPYSGERQLAGWILSLGEDTLALSPPPLVERVTQGLGRIARAHAPAKEHV